MVVPMSHYINARVWEGNRFNRATFPRQRFSSAVTEQPKYLATRTGKQRSEFIVVESTGDKPDQISVVIEILRSKRQSASIIRVAPQWARSIRAAIRGGKACHARQRREVSVTNIKPDTLPV